ncbi:Gfo/Idh/MocA family oxidoreductase [Mesorhizobium sp. M1163]|uniref:Gfo/Idh/MocA family protein n=1 Tax=Mesorhizobium sp. M1163 TaxID=2957065 RepID=UPI00333AB9B2
MPVLTEREKDIGVIGCGQFGFATIGYFVSREFGRRFVSCYDTDAAAMASFARALGVTECAKSVDAMLEDPKVRFIYIASNHASHTEYAAKALAKGKTVYVEKPISVTESQLIELLKAKREHGGSIFAGYNRPFASATRFLRSKIDIETSEGISLQCFVSGHKLAAGHWYRDAKEGTRVSGNIGHWLDLYIHIAAWRGIPDKLEISIMPASSGELDDNVAIQISSDRGDLVSIFLSSRCEPFEGINETINIQHNNTICKIDDFRSVKIWKNSSLFRKRVWPKDAGHRLAILQPLKPGNFIRNWDEVVLSTLLIIHISGMVQRGERNSIFSLTDELTRLHDRIEMN